MSLGVWTAIARDFIQSMYKLWVMMMTVALHMSSLDGKAVFMTPESGITAP